MPRIEQSVLPVIALAYLCGCASPPDQTEAPLTIPENWSSTSAPSTAPEAWVHEFGGPELKVLVEKALNNNPDLGVTAARLEQAKAEARIAGAARLPAANLGLNGTRQQISTFGPQSTGGVIFEDYALRLNGDWELDVWGRLRDEQSASIAQVEASAADLKAARLSLVARVTQAWLDLAEAREQLELSQSVATADEDNLRTIESRFQRGLALGLDLRRIRTQAANSRSEISLRQRALERARRNLELLIAEYPSAELYPLAQLPELPQNLSAGLPSTLLERRPDLVAAERRLAAAEAQLSVSNKERLPKISLTAAGGTTSQEFKNLLDENFSVWSLGANLVQPVFQGGRIQAGIERAEALRTQAAENYRATALQAFYEVEVALASEGYLKDEYEALQMAADEARAAGLQAWESYRSGTVDFLTALDAERTAVATRSRSLSLRKQILLNRIDLYLALGGPIFETP